MKNIITSSLRDISQRLSGKSDEYSEKLLKMAQDIESAENLYKNQEFDPSQEIQGDGMQDPMQGEMGGMNEMGEAGGMGEEMPVQPFAAEEENKDTTIPIESFVRNNQESVVPSNFDTHTCSVIFSAPKDIQESDMMNYILGIGKELGVEVKKFEWEKMDPKPVKGVK